MNNDQLWQTKIHARLHDPAEKALVLLRDPAGHEGGTVNILRRLIATELQNADQATNDGSAHAEVFNHKQVPAQQYQAIQKADWWAAAADRPQWPLPGSTHGKAWASWAQVRWTKKPELIHPLSGQRLNLAEEKGLQNIDLNNLKDTSLKHTESLLHTLGFPKKPLDFKKLALALWRFQPEPPTDDTGNDRLGELWRLLPADTRIPDHSIWDHLDLTSAFAGAFAADPDQDISLLTLSIGPVQSFIAAARSSSDLWAGSHLLSRLAFETMRPVLDSLGPDAVLFPRLRGIPQVDLWLKDQLPDSLFDECDWQKGSTDNNPLFSAALPNRFVAVVPTSLAKDLAEKCQASARDWFQSLGKDVVDRLLKAAKIDLDDNLPCYQQMRDQIAEFPEVHWAAVPFSLIKPKDAKRQRDLDLSELSNCVTHFYPEGERGFLNSEAWKLLDQAIEWQDGTQFYSPNPGVLYPAIYDLAERALGAAKTQRPFERNDQHGWRCSLSGESEWLTTDRSQLDSSYRNNTQTLWAKVHANKKSWAKKGEHLGALAAIKRLWPTIFAEQVEQALGRSKIHRFVVSTHTMALVGQLEKYLKDNAKPPSLNHALETAMVELEPDKIALPNKLLRKYRDHPALDEVIELAGLLDCLTNLDDSTQQQRLESDICKALNIPASKAEAYYGLMMLDGDKMGAWLSGENAISYGESFHSQVQEGFKALAQKHPKLQRYYAMPRAISPNRHLAISSALNDFALHAARHVIEHEHMGRLLYAGGDDVLAMLPAQELLSAAQRLRQVYRGDASSQSTQKGETLLANNGFAILNGQVMRMMGEKATASAGLIIAHHQAPLSAVMRSLRAAEKRAKNAGGRNAFSLSIVKRSGGDLNLTAKWGETLDLLNELTAWLSQDKVSRRAVYHCQHWLSSLPEPNTDSTQAMLTDLLSYQLKRQSGRDNKAETQAEQLAPRLTERCVHENPATDEPSQRLTWLYHFMGVAEFLAREQRQGDHQ